MIARTIIDVARELARSVPPPRGTPYFGLDIEAAYDLRVLDAFSARGIFRKYELALDVGSSWGGRARWLAARSGCRVVGVDPRLHVVAASRALNERARMDDQVGFHVGRLQSLPFRSRLFTHVWIVDPADDTLRPEVLAEAFRVLRPGAHFALQSASLPPELLAVLRHIGFMELEVCERSLAEPADVYRLAASRLAAASGQSAQGWQPAKMRTQAQMCVQIFGRRPA